MAEKSQEEGWHEPDESRGSRTDLWGTGGEIPPVYPAKAAALGLILIILGAVCLFAINKVAGTTKMGGVFG